MRQTLAAATLWSAVAIVLVVTAWTAAYSLAGRPSADLQVTLRLD